MTRFLGIDLTEGVKRRHLLAYFAAAFISSSYAGALAMLQPGLLQVMDIAPGDQAMLTGNLSAMQEVILIVLLGVMGALNLVILGGLLGLAGAWLAVSRHLVHIEPR